MSHEEAGWELERRNVWEQPLLVRWGHLIGRYTLRQLYCTIEPIQRITHALLVLKSQKSRRHVF